MKISYVQFEPGNQELKEEEELDIESQLTTLQVLSDLSDQLLQSVLFKLPLHSSNIAQVEQLSLHHSINLMMSVPSMQLLDSKQQVLLISEASNLLALFRKMMYIERYEVDIYWRLYPPGWCLISALETVHRELWCKVMELLSMHKTCIVLMQLFLMFQESWVTAALMNCNTTFESNNYRSKLGQMILVISHIQELLHINQLHVLK